MSSRLLARALDGPLPLSSRFFSPAQERNSLRRGNSEDSWTRKKQKILISFVPANRRRRRPQTEEKWRLGARICRPIEERTAESRTPARKQQQQVDGRQKRRLQLDCCLFFRPKKPQRASGGRESGTSRLCASSSSKRSSPKGRADESAKFPPKTERIRLSGRWDGRPALISRSLTNHLVMRRATADRRVFRSCPTERK